MAAGPDLHEAQALFRDAMRRSNVPAGTIKQYTMIVRRLETRYPRRKFAGITTQDLGEFLYGDDGILVGRSAQTATSYRAALRAFFRYGALKGWTKTATAVPQPVFRQRRPNPGHAPTRLTEAELGLLLRRAEHPMMRGIVAAAIFTALRICDVRKIKCGDINLSTGELYVWVQKTSHFDHLPITLDLEEELRSYLAWYANNVGAAEPDMHLFPGFSTASNGVASGAMDATKCVSYQWCLSRLKDLYSQCGITVEPREAWHVIRRSMGRIYFDRLREEVSHDHALRQTMAFLGHTKTETTETYLGLQAEIRARNASLRGRRFLTPDSTVVDIQQRRRS